MRQVPAIDPDKYLVFRASEDGYNKPELLEGEYFVIRDADIFGAAALFSYSQIIQTALELNALPDRHFLSVEEVERLGAMADWIHSTAIEWGTAAHKRKIPG